jgi:hypothetical protein
VSGGPRRAGGGSRPARLAALVLPLALAAGATRGAEAQDPAETAWRVSGRVVRPAGEDAVPVRGAWVVLHRVGRDRAAPLDSTRTSPGGAYAFRYRRTGSPEAIYFVSAEYAGIAYFTPPLRDTVVEGEDAEITVFDTTSAPIPLAVRGRHLVIGAPAVDGSREVLEVYELSNDTSIARISPDDERPSWTAPLPAGAREVRGEGGELGAGALRAAPGRVEVIAPFAPGLKQVSFRYTLPASGFPLELPVGDGADVLEVLVEDSTTAVGGAGLVEQDPVSTEGRTFRRFLADDVAPGAVVRVVTRDAPRRRAAAVYAAAAALAVGVAALIALAVAYRRREAIPTAVALARGAHAPASSEAIARAIAELDHRFERAPSPTPRERAQYGGHRAELKRRLADALEAERRRE